MDLLAASYASSSCSEDEEQNESDDARRRREETAHAAIAERFAARAKAAARDGGTAAERRFKYAPYEPKRPAVGPRSMPDTQREEAQPPSRATAGSPLFVEFARLATASHRPRTSTTASAPQLQHAVRFDGHGGAVSCVEWNPRYPPLFLSASMDSSVSVWSLPRSYYTNGETAVSSLCRRELQHHTNGVKSAKWSIGGQHVWSGGFDGHAVYVDVERSQVIQRHVLSANEHVTTVCPHASDPQVSLMGTSRGRILQRDLRMDEKNVAAAYTTKATGEIHDLLFLPDQDADHKFVSSCALSARDTSHQTLAVWDFRSTAMLADHLHSDLCAFTSLLLHPNGKHFAGQSTESEVVLFSAKAPFKRLKPKRSFSTGHDVQAYSVGCSFNSTGSLLASGDINGRVVLYCGRTQRVLRQISAFPAMTPCVAAEFHPQWESTLVVGGYDGGIRLLDAFSH